MDTLRTPPSTVSHEVCIGRVRSTKHHMVSSYAHCLVLPYSAHTDVSVQSSCDEYSRVRMRLQRMVLTCAYGLQLGVHRRVFRGTTRSRRTLRRVFAGPLLRTPAPVRTVYGATLLVLCRPVPITTTIVKSVWCYAFAMRSAVLS
eukprot:1741828-Rhodomonas_salina.1